MTAEKDMDDLPLGPQDEDSDESMSLDRELQLMFPVDESFQHLSNWGQELDRVEGKIEKLKSENKRQSNWGQELDRVEGEIEKLKSDQGLDRVEAEIEKLKSENKRQNDAIREVEEIRLMSYEADMMVKMSKEINKRMRVESLESHQNEDSHTVDAAQNLNLDCLRSEWGIERRHLQVLKKNYVEDFPDSDSLVHKTEGAFARLLLSDDFKDTSICAFWQPVFPFCFGKTIEEVAAQPIVSLTTMLLD